MSISKKTFLEGMKGSNNIHILCEHIIHGCNYINLVIFKEDVDHDNHHTVVTRHQFEEQIVEFASKIEGCEVKTFRLILLLQLCALCRLYLVPHLILNKIPFVVTKG